MAKFNAGNAGRSQRLEASRAMDKSGIQDAIQDKVQAGLTEETIFGEDKSTYINEALPESTVTPNDGVQEMLPVNNPEQVAALDEQQKERARSYSIQQRASRPVSLSNWGESSIAGIVGDANKDRMIDAMLNLRKTDSVKIPVDVGLPGQAESRAAVSYNMENFKAPTVSLVEDIDGPKQKMVDAARTRPLTSANLFSHLKMVRRTAEDDVRMYEITPDATILGFVLMENEYMKHRQKRNMIPAEMLKNFTNDEIREMTGLSSADSDSDISVGTLGMKYHEQLMMYQQVAEEGIDIIPDRHLDRENQLTKEAYEQLGLWLKQQYNLAYPMNTKKHDIGTGGVKRYDYLLTPTGVLALESSRQDAINPDIRIRTQVTDQPQVMLAHQKGKGPVGISYKDKTKGAPEAEAMTHSSAVRHIVTSNRMKSSVIMALTSLENASNVRMLGGTEGEYGGANGEAINGRLVLDDSESSASAYGSESTLVSIGDALGIGQKMADKINNTADNLKQRAAAIRQDIEAAQKNNFPADPYQVNQIKILDDYRVVAQTNAWKLNRFNAEATKALAMVQDVVEVYGQPIGFPTYLQDPTSRISYSPQVMNVQNNKFARQLFGSGTKYQIKPMSNSTKEQAHLITWAAHFFHDGDFVPEKMISEMRSRITSGDPKLKAIVLVGKKLKKALNDYDLDAPIDALLNMELVNNKVIGIGAAINLPRPNLDIDPDVKRFLDVAGKHPDEAVNLIEEAIVLSEYMDAYTNNGVLTSQMRMIEVDGIMNGIASMSAQLGIIDVMYRVGVLREAPEKVIAEYKGLEGTLRDLMVQNMRNSISDITVDPALMKKFGITEKNHAEVSNLLELVILNKDEFQKPPIMTFAYGQALARMLGGVQNAISTYEPLRLAAENSSLGSLGTAIVLHKILVRGLTDTLSPEIVSFAEALKDMTQVGMLSNEPIRFVKATGTPTSINSYTMDPVGRLVSTIQTEYETPFNGRRFGDAKKAFPSKVLDDMGKPIVGAITAELPITEVKLTALGKTSQGGFSIRQGILAQSIISNDGSVFSKLMSGMFYRQLQNESGSQVPYVSLIYDAFVADAGSFMPLLKLANKAWIEVNLKYDLIGSLTKGAVDAHARGKAKLLALSKNKPNDLVEDHEHAEYLHGLMSAEVKKADNNGYTSKSIDKYRSLVGDINNMGSLGIQFVNRGKGLSSTQLRGISRPSHMMTNAEVADVFTRLTPLTMKSLERMNKIANKATEGRAKILKTIGPNPIHEFAVDGLSPFDFY